MWYLESALAALPAPESLDHPGASAVKSAIRAHDKLAKAIANMTAEEMEEARQIIEEIRRQHPSQNSGTSGS